MNVEHINDFELFCRALIGSKDVDPTYPFIKSYLEINDYKQKDWFVFIYVLFYSIENAVFFTNYFPTPEEYNRDKFRKLYENGTLKKFGHERRGNIRNIENLVKTIEAIDLFIGNQNDKISRECYDSFRHKIKEIKNHGNWASFKLTELYEKVLGFENLAPSDLGITEKHDFNSNDGPVGGLRWVFGREEIFDKSWIPVWDELGHKMADSFSTNIGEIETCFCKWHKFCSGKYYIGHDIDELCEMRDKSIEELYFLKIMNKSGFDDLFLNSYGIKSDLKSAFRNSGLIANMHLAADAPKISVIDLILSL